MRYLILTLLLSGCANPPQEEPKQCYIHHGDDYVYVVPCESLKEIYISE